MSTQITMDLAVEPGPVKKTMSATPRAVLGKKNETAPLYDSAVLGEAPPDQYHARRNADVDEQCQHRLGAIEAIERFGPLTGRYPLALRAKREIEALIEATKREEVK